MLQEMVGQQEQVVSPFTQWRDAYFDGIDAVEEVLPELSVVDSRIEVGVGGTYQPHVYRVRGSGSQSGTLPLLDDRKQFGL